MDNVIPFPTKSTVRGLVSSGDEISEAREVIAALREKRARHPEGTRERIVAQIKLDWWEGHLASLSPACAVLELRRA